jgi:3-oxoacyl-[acyl-carrier-protein] synthase-3
MAFFELHNVKMSGIAACVPKHVESNWEHPRFSKEAMADFIATTGVEEKRVSGPGVCTSDLCYVAAEKLISNLGWDKNDIGIVVFVSQTSDYILPITSCLLQDRLGLSTDCVAIDIPLGCSGYTYGISVISSMMNSAGIKKGLLLVGETPTKSVAPNDKSTQPLFGDAGAATAFEYDKDAKPMLFHLGTDGSGYKAIIIPHGGYRNQYNPNSLTDTTVAEGIVRNDCQLALDGMDVFSFGISQAPKTVNALVNHYNIDKDSINYFVFHQANMMMNKMILKKLKLRPETVPHSLKLYGNTSSASIPLTILTEIREETAKENMKWIFCGFGVGLSWGTVYIETSNLVCPPVVEYE